MICVSAVGFQMIKNDRRSVDCLFGRLALADLRAVLAGIRLRLLLVRQMASRRFRKQ